MSTSYTASVFYGTHVPRRSPLGERLDAYVERQGGTYAKTPIDGVVIDIIGCQPTGKEHMAILIRASVLAWSNVHRSDVPAPRELPETKRGWSTLLAAFFAHEKIDSGETPPIGWYFAGSAA